jgi:hypothetical protein
MRKTRLLPVRLLSLLGFLPLVVLLSSCAKKAEGEACTDDGECASGLVCDTHGRETGRCLEPHGHGGSGGMDASADAAASDGPVTPDAPSPDSAASPPVDAGTAATPDAPGDRAPDAGAPSPDSAAPDASSATAACESYCGCMEQNCRMVITLPWANRAACLTACGGFSEMERTCFTNFCMNVPTVSAGERAHTCEHGAGALGSGECGN